jgi:methionine-rich copper-binding protein CopC
MIRRFAGGRRLVALFIAFSLILASTGSVFAHARFDRAEPPIDEPLDGAPVVLKTYYSQELTSKSSIRVLDANGVQVDLGDGHVDLDDPIRKTMLVSLPALPVGLYTIEYSADSAEDGHEYPGTAAFGVGMTPTSAEHPASAPAAVPDAGPTGLSVDAVRPLAY